MALVVSFSFRLKVMVLLVKFCTYEVVLKSSTVLLHSPGDQVNDQ